MKRGPQGKAGAYKGAQTSWGDGLGRYLVVGLGVSSQRAAPRSTFGLISAAAGWIIFCRVNSTKSNTRVGGPQERYFNKPTLPPTSPHISAYTSAILFMSAVWAAIYSYYSSAAATVERADLGEDKSSSLAAFFTQVAHSMQQGQARGKENEEGNC